MTIKTPYNIGRCFLYVIVSIVVLESHWDNLDPPGLGCVICLLTALELELDSNTIKTLAFVVLFWELSNLFIRGIRWWQTNQHQRNLQCSFLNRVTKSQYLIYFKLQTLSSASIGILQILQSKLSHTDLAAKQGFCIHEGWSAFEKNSFFV